MKRLAAVLIFICALSVPSLAGHIPAGGIYCDCNPLPNGYCSCCQGGNLTVESPEEDEAICQDVSEGAAPALDPGFVRLAFQIWLKLEA